MGMLTGLSGNFKEKTQNIISGKRCSSITG